MNKEGVDDKVQADKCHSRPFFVSVKEEAASTSAEAYRLAAVKWSGVKCTPNILHGIPLLFSYHTPVLTARLLVGSFHGLMSPVVQRGLRSLGSHQQVSLGPLHTRAKSRDHDIVRAPKKVSQGRPKSPPTSCSVVTDPRVQCEVLCDWGPQLNVISMDSCSCGSSRMLK